MRLWGGIQTVILPPKDFFSLANTEPAGIEPWKVSKRGVIGYMTGKEKFDSLLHCEFNQKVECVCFFVFVCEIHNLAEMVNPFSFHRQANNMGEVCFEVLIIYLSKVDRGKRINVTNSDFSGVMSFYTMRA